MKVLYPDRLFRVERHAIRRRVVVVIRKRSVKPFDWNIALRKAA